MSEPSVPRASKLPFLLGDALLLGCALLIYFQAQRPFDPWVLGALIACVGLGAWLGVKPFLMEYEAATRLAETQGLTTAVAQIQKLEQIAGQINLATGQWQGVQDGCDRAVAGAEQISSKMSAETKGFMEFMQKANDSERAALRLEVEKLRRAEGDWLQVLVRVLDHVLGLHSAAVRSGQPQLARQLTQFRDAVLDLTRRVGLVPYGATPGQAFDAKAHQRLDDQAELPRDAKVAETLAPGYTFQGQTVRRTLVRLEGEALPEPPGVPVAPALPRTEPPAAEVTARPGELFSSP